jgi:hypothetical protein
MALFDSLKKIWKKLGLKGQVKNFSTIELWVVNTESGTTARKLLPGFRTPPKIDIDGFKRVDGVSISGHKGWWKIYDGSIAEISDGSKSLSISVIAKTAVSEEEFGKPKYVNEPWGEQIRLIEDVRRNKQKRIIAYRVTGLGWVNAEEALRLTCHHEIANARPVFPRVGTPYIRTRRDLKLFNNISVKG